MAKKDVNITVTVNDIATQQFKKLSATVEATTTKVMGLGKSLAGIATGAGIGGAIAKIAKNTRDWALAVNDIEDATGMSGESASRLLYVGKAVNLTSEEISMAVVRMAKSASAAEQQMKQLAAQGKVSTDVFSRYGIQILDVNGKMLSAEQIFKNILEVHRRLPNGIEKTNMELEIFGRSGAKLNDLLNISSQEFDRLIKNAERVGLVISSETSQAWEDLRNKTNELTLAFEGAQVRLGNQLLPTIIDTVDGISGLIQKYQQLSPESQKMIAYTAESAAKLGLLTMGVSGLQAVMSTFGLAVINPWLGLAAAIGAAVYALDDYMDRQKQVASYSGNPMKKQTVYDNGLQTEAYFKRVEVTDPLAEALRGLTAPRNQYAGWGYRRLSADEEAAQKRFEVEVAHGQETGNPVYNEAEKRKRERERLLKAISDKYVTPPGPIVDTTAMQGKIDQLENLAASLQEKITALLETTPAAALAKLNTEITKAQNQIDVANRFGIDTSDAQAKLDAYAKAAKERIGIDLLRTRRTVAAEIALINAQTAEDDKSVADAEYEATLASLEKQKEEKWRATGDMVAAEKWYSAQVAAAIKKREEDYVDADRRIFENRLAHNNRLYEMEGTSRTVVDQLNRQLLEGRIAVLQRLLEAEKENTEKRRQLEQELADNKRRIWEINGRDLATAAAEANRRIAEAQIDFADTYVRSWQDMSSSVEDEWVKMTTGAVSFANGLENIFDSMVKNIQATLARLAYQQYVQPIVTSFWQGVFGGGSGGSSGGLRTTNPFMWAVGQNAAGTDYWRGGLTWVGEQGPELLNLPRGTSITPASKLALGAPKLEVKINNYGNSQVNVGQIKFDDATQKYILDITLDGAARNVNGYARNMKAALGV